MKMRTTLWPMALLAAPAAGAGVPTKPCSSSYLSAGCCERHPRAHARPAFVQNGGSRSSSTIVRAPTASWAPTWFQGRAGRHTIVLGTDGRGHQPVALSVPCPMIRSRISRRSPSSRAIIGAHHHRSHIGGRLGHRAKAQPGKINYAPRHRQSAPPSRWNCSIHGRHRHRACALQGVGPRDDRDDGREVSAMSTAPPRSASSCVTARSRHSPSPAAPVAVLLDVPTVAESGYPGYNIAIGSAFWRRQKRRRRSCSRFTTPSSGAGYPRGPGNAFWAKAWSRRQSARRVRGVYPRRTRQMAKVVRLSGATLSN